MARATDACGRSQPMEHDTHRSTDIITHVQPIEVKVKQVQGSSGSTESYATSEAKRGALSN